MQDHSIGLHNKIDRSACTINYLQDETVENISLKKNKQFAVAVA